MKKSRAMKEFFSTLSALQGLIALHPAGLSEFLFSATYPRCFEELEAIRGPAEELGLYQTLREALTKSQALAEQGMYDEAEMTVLNVGGLWGEASGAWDDLRRIYKSAND